MRNAYVNHQNKGLKILHNLSLGQNTNTLAIVPSLNIYEAIYFRMLYDVKMC